MLKQSLLSINYLSCGFGIVFTIFAILSLHIDKYAIIHCKTAEMISLKWRKIHYTQPEIMPMTRLFNSPWYMLFISKYSNEPFFPPQKTTPKNLLKRKNEIIEATKYGCYVFFINLSLEYLIEFLRTLLL